MKSEWTALGLSKPILQTLKELKFSKMTPVQVKKILSIFYCIFKFECKDKIKRSFLTMISTHFDTKFRVKLNEKVF